MRSLSKAAAIAFLLFLGACSFYKSSPDLTYYRGQNVPAEFIEVVRASETEILFRIRVQFAEKHLYHLVLDGNSPLAEGWFKTDRLSDNSYEVELKAQDGIRFEPGKTYRLCIGTQNPEAVQMVSSNYRCVADYEFVFAIRSRP